METQEEFKTALGQLLLDLRGNWGWNYPERLKEAKWLCDQIQGDTISIEANIEDELEDPYDGDGRIFRNCQLYGYSSELGNTKWVRAYLRQHLTHPEYCELLNP